MEDDRYQFTFEALLTLADNRRALPLSAWYALPLSPKQAGQLAARAAAGLQLAITQGESRFGAQLLSWVAAFWQNGAVQMLHDNLQATLEEPRQQALLALVQGQLLCSVKQSGARQSLLRGFQLAAAYLGPEDYLRVMRRHELLGHLGVSDKPASPAALPELLLEAQVIKRLRKGQYAAAKPMASHLDTLD